MAEKSIRSFLQQTYPNKQLIIINDGTYTFKELKEKNITEIKLNKKYILGELRNMGLKEIPENGIYLQWDDDDWHHPEIMRKQYEYMKSQSADACLLKNQVQYFFNYNVARIASNRIGTIMCKKKKAISYPTIAKSEDEYFFKQYTEQYHVVTWNNPEFYYIRFIHGHNTWDEEHFHLKSKPNTWSISQTARKYLSTVLPLYNFIKT